MSVATARLPEMIAQWCLATGKTIDDLAALSGVPAQTVKRIRQGVTDNPYFDTVAALVKAMDGSLDELAGIDRVPPLSDTVDPLSELPESVRAEDTIENLKLVRDILLKTIDRFRAVEREKDALHSRHIRTLTAALYASVGLNVLQLGLIAGVYIYDITHPDRGWFQYMQSFGGISGLFDSVLAVASVSIKT